MAECYKVVAETSTTNMWKSIAPAFVHLLNTKQRVGEELYYRINQTTNKLSNSVGLYVYESIAKAIEFLGQHYVLNAALLKCDCPTLTEASKAYHYIVFASQTHDTQWSQIMPKLREASPEWPSFSEDPNHRSSYGTYRINNRSAGPPVGTTWNIACLGDGLTSGYPYEGSNSTYPAQLQTMLNTSFGVNSFQVVNHGIDAYRTDQILSVVGGWLSTDNPRIVLLMAGGADLVQGYSVAATVSNMQSIVNIVAAHTNPDGSKPQIVVSAFPPNTTTGLGNSTTIKLYNTALTNNLTGIDVWFTTNWSSLYDSDTSKAYDYVMSDDIYLNESGYATVAKNFNAALTAVDFLQPFCYVVDWVRPKQIILNAGEEIPLEYRIACGTPNIEPSGGVFPEGSWPAGIACNYPSTAMGYYTSDGSDPDQTSTALSFGNWDFADFTPPMTIKARAYADHPLKLYKPSNVATAVFTEV